MDLGGLYTVYFSLKNVKESITKGICHFKAIIYFKNIDLDPQLANLVNWFLSLTSFFYSEEIINLSGKIKPSKREH